MMHPPPLTDSITDANPNHRPPGSDMYALVSRLFPICRSITGPGVRETLRIISEHIPLQVHEVPTGTQVFDWRVPKEWHIRDAHIKDRAGRRVVDFRQSNLHVVHYSLPVKKSVSRRELEEHLFSLPDHPQWIPYRTSYYDASWGFCLTHDQRAAMNEPAYEVCIDASLIDGSLTYGSLLLPGKTADEVLLTCHICHPSLANDNLSGIAVAVELAKHLAQKNRRYSYRFLFIPGTIGAITWLSRNQEKLPRIQHGLVLALLGDPGPVTYKKSRRGDAAIDRAAAHVLTHSGQPFHVREFEPYGYDERQFCSPGIDLPVGCLMRTPHGQYAEYHSSADNLDLVQPRYLADSWSKCLQIVEVLEQNLAYINQNPMGEPQLGRRGLYRSIGGMDEPKSMERAMLWVLNLSDGDHDLLDIAQRADLPFSTVSQAAHLLMKHRLLLPTSRRERMNV